MNKLLSTLTMAAAISFAASAQSFDECVYTPSQTAFKVFAPAKSAKVVVNIYDNAFVPKPSKTVMLKRKGKTEFWGATIKGDLKGKFYTFDTGHGEFPGIAAKAVGVNGHRGAVIDLASTDPAGWSADRRPPLADPTDQIIYELHHRDFSVARTDAVFKGKFLALAEPWAVDYLSDLGITTVHILPSFDYATIDETNLDKKQYNWGYDPQNYNVPDGSYSTNPFDPSTRINEFKRMVHALHKAGIRIVLDVVYNHTHDIDHSNFQLAYPDYFYRRNADGSYSNGSGCGNETASERPMMREYMIESVLYWINEYHIDGFRFDLMGIHDIETMNAIRAAIDKVDPSITMYGEGWSAGSCAYDGDRLAMKAAASRMPRIAAFSDEMRDALRGPFSDDHKAAFLAGLHGNIESIKFGIVGGIAHPQVDMKRVNYASEPWAAEPSQLIAYASCHDDMCLVDRLRSSIPGISDDELIRLDLLAQTAVLTSQGVPFILSGEELLRDKKGVHNSYNSPDRINRLKWSNLVIFRDVYNYYKGLIAIRKHHAAFHLHTADAVRSHLEFIDLGEKAVAYKIKNLEGIDSWKNVYVVLNADKSPVEISLPASAYTAVVANGKVDENGLWSVRTAASTTVAVAPQSALIIHD
ncbi:MAG: type I pullulanase [Muribaculaceae bacterium]|nr:type I pullulanase [Muribaculaceae bacterium]